MYSIVRRLAATDRYYCVHMLSLLKSEVRSRVYKMYERLTAAVGLPRSRCGYSQYDGFSVSGLNSKFIALFSNTGSRRSQNQPEWNLCQSLSEVGEL